ncbi:MAG: protein kinase [Oligoflexales bacterium]
MKICKFLVYIFLIALFGISCKPKSNSPQSHVDSNGESISNNGEEEIDEELSAIDDSDFEGPSSFYMLLDGSTNEELENILKEIVDDVEDGQDSNLNDLSLLKINFSRLKIPKFSAAIKKVRNLPSRKFKTGGFSDDASTATLSGTQLVKIGEVVDQNNRSIPIRAVETFDDIPLGSGEHVIVTLTKSQFDVLKSNSKSFPKPYKNKFTVQRSKSGSVTIKVSDNSLEVTRNLLRKEKLIFKPNNGKQGNIWKVVEEDLGKSRGEIESLLTGGKELGGGAFGTAYLITKEDGSQYVLKKMAAKEKTNVREIYIVREGLCVECLQYYGAVKRGNNYYMASEFAKGGELTDTIKNRPIKNNEVVQILSQAKGLADKGIINKDIKPENILITEQGPRIIDFGIVQKNPTQFTSAGTLATIAPEVARGMTLIQD